jgi:hypothetical protein
MVLNTFEVLPGQEPAFEQAVLRIAETAAIKRFSVYRLRLGGVGSQYLVVRSATSFGNAAALPGFDLPVGLVATARSELLRFDPAMSYSP